MKKTTLIFTLLLITSQVLAYSNADLNGCFQPSNSGMLEYHCFDGVQNYYYENWNPVSGCSGTLNSGTYQLSGNTLVVCDESGCAQYSVAAASNGIIVDGELYTETEPCN